MTSITNLLFTSDTASMTHVF